MHVDRYRNLKHRFTCSAVLLACAMVIGVSARTARAELEPLVTTLGTRAFDVEYELWYYVNVVFESKVAIVKVNEVRILLQNMLQNVAKYANRGSF